MKKLKYFDPASKEIKKLKCCEFESGTLIAHYRQATLQRSARIHRKYEPDDKIKRFFSVIEIGDFYDPNRKWIFMKGGKRP